MGLFDRFSRLSSSVRGSTPARLLAVFTAGSLGQRVTLVLGVGVIAFAGFKALPWFALTLAGLTLCWLAVRDFDRTNRQ